MAGLGLSLGLGLGVLRGGGGYTLPTPVLLEAYDVTTGFTIGSAFINTAFQSTPKVQGAARFYGEGSGVSGVTPLLTKLNALNIDPATMGVLVYALWLDERGQNLVNIQIGRSNAGFVGGSKSYNGFPKGLRWEAIDVSEIASLPSGAGLIDIRLRVDSQLAPYNARVGIDCLMYNAKGRPTNVIGFDDGFRSTYDIAYPYMKARNIKGTIYLPASSARIGDTPASRVSNYLVVTELLEMQADGWAICINGTDDDTSMTAKANPAACVANIQAQWAWLTSKGLASPAMYHLCYPNGYYQGDANGNPPTAVQVAAATGNGTTTVTFGAAAAVLDGMRMRGANVPDGTYVQSGGGASTTSVVVNNIIPAQTKAADFIDDSGAFFYPKLPDGISAAGVLTARTTLQDNTYSRFGFGDQALVGRARSTSAATLATMQPSYDRAILRGETVEEYIHQIDGVGGSINQKDTDFYACIDYKVAKRDAGLLDFLTKPQWYARDVNGLATLPV